MTSRRNDQTVGVSVTNVKAGSTTLPALFIITISDTMVYKKGYQAFLLPGQFAPGANRPIGPWPIFSLELSLPGLFATWPFRSHELSLPGPFAGNEISMELSLRGTFIPWNFPSVNVYLTVCVYLGVSKSSSQTDRKVLN